MKRLREKTPSKSRTIPAHVTHKPGPKQRWFDEKLDAWMENDTGIRLWCVIVVTYCVGATFYAGIIHLGGYPYGKAYGIFFVSLAATLLAFVAITGYQDSISNNTVFGSPRSWFVRFNGLFENSFEQFNRNMLEKSDKRSRLVNLFTLGLLLPLLGVALGIVYALIVVVLLLDWIRIIVIGFANLCFWLTPGSKPKLAFAYYALGAVMGVLSAIVSHQDKANMLFFMFIAGPMWSSVFCIKIMRRIRHGTPYFPT